MEFLKYKMMKVTIICLVILFIIILCFPFAYSTVKPNRTEVGINETVNNEEVYSEDVQTEQTAQSDDDKSYAEMNLEEHKSESSANFRAPISVEPVEEFENTDLNSEDEDNE